MASRLDYDTRWLRHKLQVRASASVLLLSPFPYSFFTRSRVSTPWHMTKKNVKENSFQENLLHRQRCHCHREGQILLGCVQKKVEQVELFFSSRIDAIPLASPIQYALEAK